MEKLYQVDVPLKTRETFGVIVVDGFVSQAAPIAKWAIGLPINRVLNWFEKKGGTFEIIEKR